VARLPCRDATAAPQRRHHDAFAAQRQPPARTGSAVIVRKRSGRSRRIRPLAEKKAVHEFVEALRGDRVRAAALGLQPVGELHEARKRRVREQEQSFNQIDISDASLTITVHAWAGERFSPSDARRYEWHEGSWRILKSPEPAH
jgi:hypothetical protein